MAATEEDTSLAFDPYNCPLTLAFITSQSPPLGWASWGSLETPRQDRRVA